MSYFNSYEMMHHRPTGVCGAHSHGMSGMPNAYYAAMSDVLHGVRHIEFSDARARSSTAHAIGNLTTWTLINCFGLKTYY